ncbi:MAG: response regulator [Anaerolineales bacterium]
MNPHPLAIIVEDDIFLAEIYAETLNGIHFRTEVFHDGELAWNSIPKLKPNLIILDLNLPKFSGIDVYHSIRQNSGLKDVWILIATANPFQANELNSLEYGDQNLLVLAKPISVEQLEQLAERIVFQK